MSIRRYENIKDAKQTGLRGEFPMPEKKTIQRVKRDKLEGKSISMQAGEFVRKDFNGG
jgi:hypothetical protein